MPARTERSEVSRESSALRRLGWGLLPPLLVGVVMPLLAIPVGWLLFSAKYTLEEVVQYTFGYAMLYFVYAFPWMVLLSVILALWMKDDRSGRYMDMMALFLPLLVIFWIFPSLPLAMNQWLFDAFRTLLSL